jgi:hypothetical protein
MKKAWTFLNSPLIVAFIAVGLLAGLVRLGLADLFSAFDTENSHQNEVTALGRLELISFKEAQVAPNATQKFVGEFKNHSAFIVHNVQGTVCFYDGNGALVDVLSGILSGVGKVPPNESAKFYIEGDANMDGFVEAPTVKRKEGMHSTITFVDLEVTEPEEIMGIRNVEDPFQ